MYTDFIEALNKKYGCNSKEELTGMDLQHYQFASSTNGRASDAIGVFEAFGFRLEGLKILDIGCAYGGFCIEAAKKGAVCYGVEISKPLYDFACLNGKNETYDIGNVEFVLEDATSPQFLKKVPLNYFDLIIVNDVFEHVYNTVQLLSNLEKVSNDRGAIYFAIPNGNDLRFVAKEGHSGYCGISLLKPLSWHKINDQRTRNIYYRDYEYYLALFNYYGFKYITETNYPAYIKDEDAKNYIDKEFSLTQTIVKEKSLELPKPYVSELEREFSTYKLLIREDKDVLKGSDLMWKYLTKFWVGFALKKELQLQVPNETSKKSFMSDFCDNICFQLEIKGKKCSVQVFCDFEIEEYEFAFRLMRRWETICSSSYQKESNYEWELESSGMYSVTIFVKHKESEQEEYRIITQPLYYTGK